MAREIEEVKIPVMDSEFIHLFNGGQFADTRSEKTSKDDRPPHPEMPDLAELDTFEKSYAAALAYRDALYMHNRGSEAQVAETHQAILTENEQKAGLMTDPLKRELFLARGPHRAYLATAAIGDTLPESTYVAPHVYRGTVTGIIRGNQFFHAYREGMEMPIDHSDIPEHRDDQLRQIVQHTVLQHPFVQTCLAIEASTGTPKDSPLSPLERQAWTRRVTQTVMDQFGIDKQEDVRQNIAADRQLQGRLALLDDMRTPRKDTAQDPDKLRNYLKQWYNRAIGGTLLDPGESGNDNHLFYLIKMDDGNKAYVENNGRYVTVAALNGQKSTVNRHFVLEVISPRLRQAICGSPEKDELGVAEYIIDAIRFQLFRRDHQESLGEYISAYPPHDDIETPVKKHGLLLPPGINESTPYITGDYERELTPRIDCSLNIAGNIYREPRADLIEVDPQPEHVTGRLLLDIRHPSPLPKDTQPDLVIRQRDHNVTIGHTILGYDKIQCDDPSMRLFKKNEEDPYERCSVQLDDSQREILIHWFTSQGLDEISSTLSKTRSVDVQALSEIIRDCSDYAIGGEHEKYSPKVPVKNGRAQLQCSGASVLLRDALNILWPDNARTIAGQNLAIAQKTQRLVNHAQTLFARQGRQYVLDATPNITAEDEENLLAIAQQHGYDTANTEQSLLPPSAPKYKRRIKPLKKDSQPLSKKPVFETYTEPIVTPEIKEYTTPEDVYTETVQQLCAIFGAETVRDLYKKMPRRLSPLQTKENDPIHQGLDILKEASEGRAISDERLAQTMVYIQGYAENYPHMPAKTKHYLKLQPHSQETLTIIENALRSVTPKQPEQTTQAERALGARIMKLLLRRNYRGSHARHSLRPERYVSHI